VINDDSQIALALAIRDLIDPDPRQAVKEIGPTPRHGGHTLDDGSDGPPRDPHQLRDSGLAVLTASHAPWSSKSRVKREL
jgi:hypothetical protein